MASVSKCYGSRYLKARDLDGQDVTVRIQSAAEGPITSPDGKTDQRIVVGFDEFDKPFVLNKTNARSIAEIHGDNSDDWRGQLVTLYPTETPVAGVMTACIRIRSDRPQPVPAGQDVPDIPF